MTPSQEAKLTYIQRTLETLHKNQKVIKEELKILPDCRNEVSLFIVFDANWMHDAYSIYIGKRGAVKSWTGQRFCKGIHAMSLL